MSQDERAETPARELENFAEVAGEAGQLVVEDFRITLPVTNRATGATYHVTYGPVHKDVVQATATKGSLLIAKGRLYKDPKYESGEVLIRGWNPEEHLFKATADDASKPPTGRVIGFVTQLLPRNLVEVCIISTYNDKEYENTIALGLSSRVRRLFRSRVHIGAKIRAKLILAGEKFYPWDGTPRIVDFSILKE